MSVYCHTVPIGVVGIQKLSDKCCRRVRFRRELLYKCSIFALTYATYTCYHMTRKPISVVKSVLHRNCSGLEPPTPVDVNDTTWCSYAPFDEPDAGALFGALDSAFLFTYAVSMFISGVVAERISIRHFLAVSMLMTGLFTYLFGLGKTENIHNIWYFLFVQVFAGLFQSTGWPGVVTVLGRWFGKSKRGLIFGLWVSHTSVGNILGTVIAANYVEKDWSLSFIVPGVIIAVAGLVVFLFLVDSPHLVGIDFETASLTRVQDDDNHISSPGSINSEVNYRPTERTPMLRNESPLPHSPSPEQIPIKIWTALYIPGVAEFSLCLFFCKLVSYTFLFWLPLYIESTAKLGATVSANLSTLFDIGGIAGAIVAGMISDSSSMAATTCASMLFLAAPTLLMYQAYGATTMYFNIILLFLAGLLVNGPYGLITTSVSAELGQHSSLEGNSKALSTVTAIIDGTGSIGAAVGPLLAGFISSTGWQNVFYMLITADILAMLFLSRLVLKEIQKLKRNPRIE